LKAPADFKGKKIATPQLGNTQDISCRAWLTSGGLRITQLGGDRAGAADAKSRSAFAFSGEENRRRMDG